VSPWLQERRGLLRGPARRFVGGAPDPGRWGGGFYANMREAPPARGVRVCEVSPVAGRDSGVLAAATPRSLEVVRDPGGEAVRLLAAAAPGDGSWPAETGHDCAGAGAAAPGWARDGGAVAFDFELSAQLNFAPLAPPDRLLNQLVRTAASRRGDGVWVQAVFALGGEWLARAAREHHAALERAAAGGGKTAGLAERLGAHYAARASSPLVALSVRGAVLSPEPLEAVGALAAALSSVRVESDALAPFTYPAGPALPWLESRALASPRALALLAANASAWGGSRLGDGLDLSPVLAATPAELAALLRLPDDPALRVGYRRRRRGGPEGAVLGHDLSSGDYAGLRTSPACLALEHAGSHVYVLGGTGTGKTSLLRSIMMHLATPKAGAPGRAVIVIDVKDDDALAYLAQVGPNAVRDGRVTYIDVNRTDFAINPLELPPHEGGARDLVVSRHVGHVLSMLKEVYLQQHLLVQVERVMRLLLAHLYSRTPTPTMADLYALITQCIGDPTAAARRMAASSPGLEQALASLSRMPRDSWIPLVNRIEPFAADPYMRSRLCARRGTVDFGRMLEPGRVTIFRVPEAETPAHAHAVMPAVIAAGAWNALLARAESGRERTPVTLFLDEFQMMRNVEMLGAMLSRGRSLGLGLVLAHQNRSQVGAALLDTIAGNATTHICGRVLGADARAVATALDPAHAATLEDQLSGLPNRAFLISRTPPDGAERAPPARFEAHAPPPALLGAAELGGLMGRMSEEHRPGAGGQPPPPGLWRSELAVELPTRLEWHILLSLRAAPATLTALARGAVGAGLIKERHGASAALASMERRGLVRREGPGAPYSLAGGAGAYLPGGFGAVGRAEGVEGAARAAFGHYASMGHFVAVAAQGGTRGSPDAVDMVAYDYESGEARSVEIESRAEVRSNPEHVAFNMAKWEGMGFAGCDVWSDAPAVERIRLGLDERLRPLVRCFVLQGGEWAAGPALEGAL